MLIVGSLSASKIIIICRLKPCERFYLLKRGVALLAALATASSLAELECFPEASFHLAFLVIQSLNFYIILSVFVPSLLSMSKEFLHIPLLMPISGFLTRNTGHVTTH